MSLWVAMTAMIAVAAVFAAAPFIRRRERRRLESEKTVAVYRDQLKELDAEAAQGAIDPAQAESSRTEIKRRILSMAPEQDESWPALSSGEKVFAAIGVAAVVVVGSVILFTSTADLEFPTKDTAAKVADANADVAPPSPAPPSPASPSPAPGPQSSQGATPSATATTSAAAGGKPQTQLPSVEELTQRLVDRLQKNPKDVEGWRMLGWSYFNISRYQDAADAYGHAVELNPDSAEYRDGELESLVRAANGTVTSDARAVMDETLKRHPRDSRALFLKGVAQDQSGDRSGAEQIWKDLKQSLDANDPWAKEVDKKLVGASDVAPLANAQTAKLPSPAPSTQSIAEAKGPTATDVRAAESMSQSDRTAMIQGMVNSLADRLEKSPRDSEGWIRLVRSWMVLGEPDKAKGALAGALKAFADDPEQSQRIAAAAEAAGVNR